MDEDSPKWLWVPQSHTDWSSQYGSESPALKVVGCEWRYALLVVQARNDDDDDVFELNYQKPKKIYNKVMKVLNTLMGLKMHCIKWIWLTMFFQYFLMSEYDWKGPFFGMVWRTSNINPFFRLWNRQREWPHYVRSSVLAAAKTLKAIFYLTSWWTFNTHYIKNIAY